MSYELVAVTPTVEEYCRLRTNAGLSGKSAAAAAIGLPNTWYAVVLKFEGVAVGMGRILGDGGTAFQITDIALEPAHQGKGHGKAIVSALMAHLRANAPASAYVSLIADGAAQHLYAKFGFEPVMPEAIGMATRIQ